MFFPSRRLLIQWYRDMLVDRLDPYASAFVILGQVADNVDEALTMIISAIEPEDTIISLHVVSTRRDETKELFLEASEFTLV
jgi:hypothetical protein